MSNVKLMLRLTCLVLLSISLGLSSSGVLAQIYPSKPIRFIVPFPPGGGTDVLARTLAQAMEETLKWRVVVDNRPGAGGTVGLDAAAKSAPDGYTIVLGESANLAIFPTLYTKLPYDPVKDFQPITLVGSVPLVLVVAADKSYKSLGDVIAAAKTGSVTMASSGNGGVGHLVGEMLKRRAGIDLLHVPYKGATPAMTDVLAGQVDIFFASLPAAIGPLKGGRLRALAVTTAQRAPALPEVPTIAESGYSNFDAGAWYGILVPAGTPASIVSRLNADITKILQLPHVHTRLVTDGVDVLGGSPVRFSSFIAAEVAKWGQAVKDSGAKVD